MSTITWKEGSTFVRVEDAFQNISIILSGSVIARYPGGEIVLEKGDVIGVLDLCHTTHSFTYHAQTDVAAITYPYEGPTSLLSFLSEHKESSVLLPSSITKQLCQVMDHFLFVQFDSNNLYQFILDGYRDYSEHCNTYQYTPKTLPNFEDLTTFYTDQSIEPWLNQYYDEMKTFSQKDFQTIFQGKFRYLTGYLLKASQDAQLTLHLNNTYLEYNNEIAYYLLNEDKLDILDLYTDLLMKLAKSGKDYSVFIPIISRMMLYMEGLSAIPNTLYESRIEDYQTKLQYLEASKNAALTDEAGQLIVKQDLQDSLSSILDYSEAPQAITDAFRTLVISYRNTIDKSSTKDEYLALCKNITKLFHVIYMSCFEKSIFDANPPTIIKMFLSFGYVDETLCGLENANFLYELVEHLNGDAKNGIYTFYEWLQAIYYGKKEPSRNEFDMDYTSYIHDQKVGGKITAAEESMLMADAMGKVHYELSNMFPIVNKLTYGRIIGYCPVLSEHSILKPLKDCLTTPTALKASLAKILSIDYTAFHREVLYSNPECDIQKEYILAQYLPDIILMPNVGSRGIMWQEIEGKRRNTSSRMMMSIFSLTDIYPTMIRLTGEYRWEICKRIQGTRWNDVSEHSLTSEYFDYIQFYRKNHDLSLEAKEKIKSMLIRLRNSYKECFVQDYLTYILYESDGSIRLNKLSRRILFTYCPFAIAINNNLKSSPIYSELLSLRELKTNQKLHRYDLLTKKIKNTGKSVPKEILEQIQIVNG